MITDEQLDKIAQAAFSIQQDYDAEAFQRSPYQLVVKNGAPNDFLKDRAQQDEFDALARRFERQLRMRDVYPLINRAAGGHEPRADGSGGCIGCVIGFSVLFAAIALAIGAAGGTMSAAVLVPAKAALASKWALAGPVLQSMSSAIGSSVVSVASSLCKAIDACSSPSLSFQQSELPELGKPVATALHHTYGPWRMMMAASSTTANVIGIALNGTGSGKLELHSLQANDGFQSFHRNVATALPETSGANRAYAIANNGDLYVFNMRDDPHTSIQVLSAASNYQQVSHNFTTALPPTNQFWEFQLAKNNDLFAITKFENRTELRVLTRLSGYTKFLHTTVIPLGRIIDRSCFLVRPDRQLVGIIKNGGQSGQTEQHILSESSGYTSFVAQRPVDLHETGANWSFGLDHNLNLWGIRKYEPVVRAPNSGKTEVVRIRRD